MRGKRAELTLLASPSATGPMMILVVGLGAATASRSLAMESAAAAVRLLSDRPRKRVTLALADGFPESMHDAIVAGAVVGSEGQGIYQSDPSLTPPEEIAFLGVTQDAMLRGQVVGESINHTRRLVNEPPASLYPETFATMAAEVMRDTGVVLEVWDEARLSDEGCRAILAVGAGSVRPPRLVIMRYKGGGEESPLAIVGKGVTFDSGGLSLKPSDSMVDMKCDMAGAATVVGVMHAIAKLGVRQNVVGLCGLAENMVSGSSYKLGDVIKTRSGKTIEILNTDAEGRVVLADTLDVALQSQPRAMVDLATLTGACLVALGNEVAGLMTNQQETLRPDFSLGEHRRGAGMAVADVRFVQREDQEQGRRHQERWRGPMGRSDHGSQVPGEFRGRGALGAHRHRRSCLCRKSQTVPRCRRDRVRWFAPCCIGSSRSKSHRHTVGCDAASTRRLDRRVASVLSSRTWHRARIFSTCYRTVHVGGLDRHSASSGSPTSLTHNSRIA